MYIWIFPKRVLLYILWFCITMCFLYLLNYLLILPLSLIELLTYIYIAVAITAFVKDILDEIRVRIIKNVEPFWFRWFEHSGIVIAFITFAFINKLWHYNVIIQITLTLMVIDLVFDLYQDTRMHYLRKKMH